MKTRLGLSMLLVTALVLPGIASKNALKKAQDLFVLISCKPVDADTYPMGSAFPFGEHFLFTARHVECPEGQRMLVSKGGNVIASFAHPDLDARVLVVDGPAFHDFASIRGAEMGENTTGFGAAVNIIATFGRVMKIISEQSVILTSNTPLGGMSGSALVADDGDVVGMTVFGYHDERVGGAVTGAISGETLKKLADTFPAFYKSTSK